MHITRSATFTFVCRRLTKQKSSQNAFTLRERDRDRELYSDERKKGREALDRLLTQKRRRREESEKTKKNHHHHHQSLKLSTMPSLQTPCWVQNLDTQQAMKLQKRKCATKGATADERRRERQRRRRRRRATATSSFSHWSGCCVGEEEEEDQPSPHGILPPLSGYNKQEAPVTGATSNRNHQLQLLMEPVTVQPYQPRAAWNGEKKINYFLLVSPSFTSSGYHEKQFTSFIWRGGGGVSYLPLPSGYNLQASWRVRELP